MKRGLDIFMDMIKLCSVTFASNLNFNEKKSYFRTYSYQREKSLMFFFKKKGMPCIIT